MAWEYNDNVLVGQCKFGADFFQLTLREATAGSPEELRLGSYQVPGRTDNYVFGWQCGHCGVGYRITFFTDCSSTLAEALRMLQHDLNRAAVVKLMRDACKADDAVPYLRTLAGDLLPALAPKSKVLAMLREELERRRQERRALLKRQRKE